MSTKLGVPCLEVWFCSVKCESKNASCAICLAQRRKIRDDEMIKSGKPTLTHNPFAVLGGRHEP